MLWTWVLQSLVVYLVCALGSADELDLEVESGLMMRMLRDMANQTAADSLSLPANASSIRENITDTFSCENRTYGYYADVDNDCQIFHVCLPSQTARGRNITYKWSFICPNETVFNQEVIVCTRPEDAIECKDSPNYYDLNKEIGKEPNKTRIAEENEVMDNTIEVPMKEVPDKKVEQVFPSRNPVRRPVKQNYIIQQLIKEIVDEEMSEKLQSMHEKEIEVFPVVTNNKQYIENRDKVIIPDEINESPAILNENEPIHIENRDRIVLPDINVRTDFNDKRAKETEDYERDDDRLILERSMSRHLRGGIKYYRH